MSKMALFIGLFFLLVPIMAFLLDQKIAEETNITTVIYKEDAEHKVDSDIQKQFKKELFHAAREYENEQFLEALARLEQIEANAESAFIQHATLSRYYTLKGLIHWELWHHVDAENAWRQAIRFTEDRKQIRYLNKLINHNHLVIEELSHERGQRSSYEASPQTGPAKILEGKIVYIYIFLQDGGSGRWGVRSRNYVLDTWKNGQQWLQDYAGQYGKHIEFVQRSFIIDRNPSIKRLKVGDVSTGFRNADTVAYLVAQHFGYRNLDEFANAIKVEEGADQAMVFLHLPRNARSFASRCMRNCPDFGEFIFLLEAPSRKDWQSLEYTQTHEALHVFGADDLYNIEDAKYFSPKDIMNYPSSFLSSSTLDPITAYAVGLINEKPDAPFDIYKR